MAGKTGGSTQPTLTGAEPQLFVSDIQATCDFFTLKLGFGVAFLHGEPAFYGQVFRDGARLNLRHVDAPLFDNALREREDLLSAIVTLASVDGIEALFLEFQKTGAPFHRPLRLEPWGARTFIVKDPDGNLLLFAGPME
jgi:catechol 2,3-dioxygenase-like lactoylglutathione lyase family enzyme